MQIFVDADACPVVFIVEAVARKYGVAVTLLCDTNHILYSDYSEVVVVGAGADAVDYKLISICHRHRGIAGLWSSSYGSRQRGLCDSSVRQMVYK